MTSLAAKGLAIEESSSPSSTEEVRVKDRFMYEERDLSDWLDDRLKAAFMGHLLVDTPTMRINTRDSRFEGDAFVSKRKVVAGESGASSPPPVTFNISIYIYWYGKMMLGDATIGDAEGRICVKDVAYDVEGEGWEVEVLLRHEYGQAARNPGADRELWPAERTLRDGILNDGGLQALRDRVKEVQDDLRAGGVTGSANMSVVGQEEAKAASAEDAAAGLEQKHSASVTEYMYDLQRKALNKKLLRVLDGEAKEDEEVGVSFSLNKDEFMQELGDALVKMTCLKKLDLSWNHFTDEGLKKVLPGVEQSSTLTELNLSNNPEVGDAGLQALASAIGYDGAPALCKVNLTKTNISPLGQKMLAGIKMLRPTIEFLFDAEAEE